MFLLSSVFDTVFLFSAHEMMTCMCVYVAYVQPLCQKKEEPVVFPAVLFVLCVAVQKTAHPLIRNVALFGF